MRTFYWRPLSLVCLSAWLAGCAGMQPQTSVVDTSFQLKGADFSQQIEQIQALNQQRWQELQETLKYDSVTHASQWRQWQTPNLPEYDLWDRLRASFQWDVHQYQNPRIQEEMQWFLAHPSFLDRMMTRMHKYLYHVVTRLEAKGLPGELALLPVIESAYNPFAYSHGHAAGMWQFIPSTGRHFGLHANWWYDGRRDVLSSTEAALTYLKRLNQRFDGDWLLALAAYNAGSGNVNKALRKDEQAGGQGQYWDLDLPAETKAYVPRLLAVAKIFAEPERYGLAIPSVKNQPYFAVVDTQGQLDLNLAAKMAGISLDELKQLNPAYSRWATNPEGPHRLLVPVAKAQKVSQQLASLPPEKRVTWQKYRIRSGDTLLAIARRFDTSVKALQDTNKLRNHRIRAGKELLIPQPMQAYAQAKTNTKPDRPHLKPVEYQVRAGDSLWRVARQHRVSVHDLARWNTLGVRDILRPGQKLLIHTASTRNSASSLGYTVRKGDSLYTIANRFRVSVQDIADWNKLNPRHYLQPGQKIKLYVDLSAR